MNTINASAQKQEPPKKIRLRSWLSVTLMPFILGGCASVDVTQYQHEKPALAMQQFFAGKLDGWGMFQDRSGKVIKRFQVVIDAQWQNNVGTLDEKFTWSDNNSDNPPRRVWTLKDLGNGRLIGSAGDVVGEAQGEVSGNTLHWRYILALPVDGKIIHVDFDDWMYLVDKDTLLNRSVMSKYGIRLGEVTLTLHRRQPQAR